MHHSYTALVHIVLHAVETAVYIVAPGLWLNYRINVLILNETNFSGMDYIYLGFPLQLIHKQPT